LPCVVQINCTKGYCKFGCRLFHPFHISFDDKLRQCVVWENLGLKKKKISNTERSVLVIRTVPVCTVLEYSGGAVRCELHIDEFGRRSTDKILAVGWLASRKIVEDCAELNELHRE